MNNHENVKWGRPPKYTPEQQEMARSLHSRGVSIRDIAQQVGLSKSSVARILNPVAPSYSNGVNQSEFDALFARQGGRCGICRKRNRLFVDHDHKTGKTRGLLCNRCNLALGFMLDSVFCLGNAIVYLSQEQENI